MNNFTATFESWQKYPDADAWETRLRVSRDGENFRLVTVRISGRGLLAIGRSRPDDNLMSALARAAEPLFRNAAAERTVRPIDGTEGYLINISDSHTLRTCAESSYPLLKEGEVAWSFDIEAPHG